MHKLSRQGVLYVVHKNLKNSLHFFSHFLTSEFRLFGLCFGKHKKARSAFADKHYDIALRNAEKRVAIRTSCARRARQQTFSQNTLLT